MECKNIQSSSASRTTWKHDVLVSFRGDTRKNFIDHLFGAFRRKGILSVFRDDRNIKQGDHISTELMQAIEGSRVLIVIFSKNYATSSWCLQELAKIVDSIQSSAEQTVLPVFYDVDPSEVRKQSGDYGKAFAEHEERFKLELEKVQQWREALVHVASISGWDIQNKPQYDEIEKIVEKVISILCYKFSSVSDDLVRMHSPVEQLEKLLVLDSDDDDVRVVGICGMDGIGKTTLARVVYDRNSPQYGASCYIDDVSKTCGDYGPIGAQKQLLYQTLNEGSQEIWNLSMATSLLRTRLCHVKALIVLDNVDKVEQLENLGIKREWLCAGSKIIIISRDEHILREYGVDEIYNVQLLNRDKALKLFCKKAFKCDDIMRDYEELTDRALNYAKGLPLAIKVLGSFLFGRDIFEWKSALARLRDYPKKEIMDVLQISFDGLEQTEKAMFLDIACFFIHKPERYVKRVLDCCGFHPEIGIRVLIDKSLITVQHGRIRMHDMLRELGMKIVREKAPNEPTKWSRIWLYEDFLNVAPQNKAVENLEAVVLLPPMDQIGKKTTTMRAEVLSKMSCLRLLILKDASFSGSLNYLSNEIQYLEWDKYPFTYLLSSFEPDKLVELILPHSNIKQLWDGIKPLHNLRVMDLHHSKNLIKTPDFRSLPNLERLNLEECTRLVQIDPSIGHLRKLVDINLKNCTSLMSLPSSMLYLSSLEVLNLLGCSKLFSNKMLEKGRHAEHLKQLDVSETAIQCQSTSSIGKRNVLLPFNFFRFRRHKNLVGSLLPSLPSFSGLQDLDLSFCNLLKIPDAIGCLHCLERLDIGGNKFATLPSSIKELPRLRSLNLQHCKQLKYLFDDLSSTTILPLRQEFVCDYYWASFCIFNCPKLVEMKSWSSVTLSWIIQVLQVLQESSIPHHSVDFVIPGTQIPRWFNNRSVGSSIIIESFPNVNDSNWIGVAVSAAFVLHEDPTTLNSVKGHPVIMCCFGNETRMLNRHFPVLVDKDLVTVELSHLFLLYVSRPEFIDFINWVTEETHKADGIRMEVSLLMSYPDPHCTRLEEENCGLHLEVKNCGLRWVFKQDLEQEQSSLTMTNDDLGIEPICNPKEGLAQPLV